MSEGGPQRRGDGSRSALAGRPGRVDSLEQARAAVGARMRERLPEVQAAVATRVHAISDPRSVADPSYLQGLEEAVSAAIEYRLAVLEAAERSVPPPPPVLLAQARLDARDGVPLDTVLRRYFAGNALFGDFLVEEAERAGVSSAALRRLLAAQATVADGLLATVSAEHAREAGLRPGNAAERRRECVKRLLAGELVDRSQLAYDLDARHLAVIAKGEGGEELLRGLASSFGRRLLAVRREEEPVWAGWLGGQSPLAAADAASVLADAVPEKVIVTLGEPGEGLAGWRFSHLQAKAALPIAERGEGRVLRYADVAVLATVARDDLLADSLRQIYLAPLERARDGGESARETLRAYFAAERNVSSTAAALGVDRRTVSNRLGAIEALLGRRLKGSLADLEIALRLEE